MIGTSRNQVLIVLKFFTAWINFLFTINLSVQFSRSLFTTDNHPSCWKKGGVSGGSLADEISSLVPFG